MKSHILKSIGICLSLGLFCTSCATPAAWEHTNPDSLNRMPKNSYTENFIIQNNLRYAPDRDEDYYLVEKTLDQKFSCYLGRITLVPAAIVLDAALICGIALGGAAAANPDMFNTSSSSAYSYKPPTMYTPSYPTYNTPTYPIIPQYTRPAPRSIAPPPPVQVMMPRKSREEDEYKYRGSSGARYKYDLSIPTDAMRYEMDLKAQMQDSMSLDLKRDRDRGLGQWGGGIKK